MYRKSLWICLAVMLHLTNADAQTCRVLPDQKLELFKRNYAEELKLYQSLVFSINGKTVSVSDTLYTEIPINKKGFDTVRYSFRNSKNELRKETFLCKLRADETYKISPCTCCGIFLMVPAKNPQRGFVKFENKSNQELLGMASEYDYDTIPKKSSTDFIPALISMNCGFRPSDILVFERIQPIEKIIYKTSFLFLHEERLLVTIEPNAKKVRLRLEEE